MFPDTEEIGYPADTNSSRRLLAVLAHPDDESLGCGGTLAKYAAEGVDTFLLTATRGERGRYYGHPYTGPGGLHPGHAELGRIREAELREAATALGVRRVDVLDYEDQLLDQADPATVIAQIATHIRRVRPQVVLTFAPDGAYGHPDHVAISQFTTAAIVSAAGDAASPGAVMPAGEPHVVSKLYYIAWSAPMWAAYTAAFRRLVSTVDGIERQATPWPEWAITTVIDTRAWWPTVWSAVSAHRCQMGAYEKLGSLPSDHHASLWGTQAFYRAFSLVNGGRSRETDLFDGISAGQARSTDDESEMATCITLT